MTGKDSAREAALAGLAKRREKGKKDRANNAAYERSARAGMSMRYNCQMCGITHDVRSESDFSPVARYCRSCDTDLKNGLLSASD